MIRLQQGACIQNFYARRKDYKSLLIKTAQSAFKTRFLFFQVCAYDGGIVDYSDYVNHGLFTIYIDPGRSKGWNHTFFSVTLVKSKLADVNIKVDQYLNLWQVINMN